MKNKNLLLGLAVLLVSGFVVAQQAITKQATVYTAMTAPELAKILKAAGYAPSVGKDDEGDPMVKFVANGETLRVYFYDCKKEVCPQIAFSWYSQDVTPVQKNINTWNAENYYARAYIDEDDDAVLEYDLNIGAELSANAIKAAAKGFVVALEDFIDNALN